MISELKTGQSCEGMQKLLELFGHYSDIVDEIAICEVHNYSYCSAKCQIDLLAGWVHG